MRAPAANAQEHEVALVAVVDDDASLRDALDSLFRSVGWRVATFGSAAALLQSGAAEEAACLVLDVRLPGTSGLDFQAQLAQSKVSVPIIFMTGHGDIPMSVQAMKAGAVDFLPKPFRDQSMLDAVSTAIQRDAQRRDSERSAAGLQALYQTLSPRERQIMTLVTRGLLNKQIAGEINLSEITVKIHRGAVMRKMRARTFAELVRMAESLGLHQN